MRLDQIPSDPRDEGSRTRSTRTRVTDGVKKGVRGLRSAATVLPGRLRGSSPTSARA